MPEQSSAPPGAAAVGHDGSRGQAIVGQAIVGQPSPPSRPVSRAWKRVLAWFMPSTATVLPCRA